MATEEEVNNKTQMTSDEVNKIEQEPLATNPNGDCHIDDTVETTVTTNKDENEKIEIKTITEPTEKVVDSQIKPTNGDSTEEYEKFITYNDEGIAFYTDPTTHCKYKFCTVKNEWIPAVDGKMENSDKPASTNPYENEHYRWCHETNKWIPKQGNASETIENEHYKWDPVRNEWILKDSTIDSANAGYVWDDEKKAWFPKIDEEFMANYQLSYGFVDSSDTAKTDDSKLNDTKENATSTGGGGDGGGGNDGVGNKNKRKQSEWFEVPSEQNSKVYVDNLPDDITEQEFIDLMSKCGMILKDPNTGKYKTKLYAEKSGQLKGDGLCHYIRVESVQLALNLLDGSDYRGRKLKVQRAKFQMRGEYNPSLKPKKKKADKEKLKKMQEKLLDWRPEKLRGERSKHERVVIIKNLFTPELFEKEVHLIIDYQKDLREECLKCGTVRKVIIYDRHPEGVAQISMADPEEADLVVQMMNRRYFGSRRLIAELWDGKAKYKIDETGAEENERLTNWDQFLETDDGDAESKKPSTEPISE